MASEQETVPTRIRWLLYICAGIGFGIIAASVEAWHKRQSLLTAHSLVMALFGAVLFSAVYGIGMEVLSSNRRDSTRRDDLPLR